MGSALTRTTGDRTKTKHSVFWRDLFRFKRNKARWSIWCLGICCQHLIPLFHWLNCALPRMESFFFFFRRRAVSSPRLTASHRPKVSKYFSEALARELRASVAHGAGGMFLEH